MLVVVVIFSHECAGGEVHRGWRCPGAHRGQAGGYGCSATVEMLVYEHFCVSLTLLSVLCVPP